jgi:D-alanyl-D-alanine carboxypeptidase
MGDAAPFHSAWMTGDGRSGASGEASAVFPWWSFTKTVLAIAALRLVEEGRLALDAARPGRLFTLRQLLTHRAGVANYGRLAAYHEAVARGDEAWGRARLLEEARADALLFEPGAGWAYSNIGYMFVADAIEQASGLGLAEALRRLVLDPLGLGATRLAADRDGFRHVFWPSLRRYDPRWVYHGCLVGPAADAARLLHGLFAGELLAPALALAMHQRFTRLGEPPSGRPGGDAGYGMGLMIGRIPDVGRVLGHSGAGPGSVATVSHFPDLSPPVTVAVFAEGGDEGVVERRAIGMAQAGAQVGREPAIRGGPP